MKVLKLYFSVVAILLATHVFAQIPPGYYDSAQGQSGAQLKTALYNIIKGHTEYPYTSSATDTWDILKEADRDPNNPNNVIGIYSGFSMNGPAEYDGGDGWSREHVWSQSRGNLGTSLGPGTDCHNLRAEDASTNAARGNLNFAESTTQYIDMSGQYSGATQSYIGPGDTWEPRPEMKGDVARTLFYMATRYEGENGEPDLELTETLLLQGDESPLHGRLSDLLLWHAQDPVDSAEMIRNNIIYGYQNNRNPFIDHPEYVTLIWGPPPSSLPFFTSAPVTSATESVTYQYTITTDGGQALRILSAPILPPWLTFSASGNGNGTISGTPTAAEIGSHSVVLEITDGTDTIIQNFNIVVSASGGSSAIVFINEIHYDNSGSDQGEAIELAAAAGTNLSGWSLVLYNGGDGAAYNTVNLTGVFTDQNNGFGFIAFSISGIQNGSSDAIALVNTSNEVVQFLSYEGSVTASDGPASGMLSTDIGQSEAPNTPVGFSLQLSGAGTTYSDFSWENEAAHTFGMVNNNQTFSGSINQSPQVSITSPTDGADFSTLNAVNITANASDTDGSVVQVEFFVDGLSIGTDSDSPYSVSWIIPDWGTYAITAVATDNNAATTVSGIVNITATNTASETVFINEIHYDNSGADQGEAIELAGNAGTSLVGWSLLLYNGTDGTIYDTADLSGTFTDEADGFGFITFSISGIQNGSSDAIALVNTLNEVVQFLSYEGSVTASEGPADGMLSTDIGRSETSNTPVGFSLQLSGTGSTYSDFSWENEAAHTFGAVNTGQSFLLSGASGMGAKSSTAAEDQQIKELHTVNVEPDIRFYPNPFAHNLSVDVTSTFIGKANIAIYDSSGKLVYTGDHYKNENDTRITLETARLDNGLFLVRIQLGDEVFIKKVMKR